MEIILSLWLLESATYTNPEALLQAQPVGLLNAAATPMPLANAATPLPARVLTLQTQVGSALRPAVGQLEGVVQGMAGAGDPPGQ